MIEGHEPNPELHYVVGFSGGKDSVATWLFLTRELKLPHVTCLFCDTGHESPILHEYLDMLDREHGLNLVRLKPRLVDFVGELVPEKICDRLGLDVNGPWRDEVLDMERLAILKRRFPSSMARFCTDILKIRPSARWMRENCDDNTIRVSGMRAQESPRRAARSPFEFDDSTGKMLWLPIHKWTHDQVFEMHKRHCIPPNPLYLQGMGRVGCFPCIMARKTELVQIARRFPEAFERLAAMESRVAASAGKPAMSFFSNSKTPEHWHSEVCEASGKSFPNADDVRRWAMNEEPAGSDQPMMFEEDWTEDAHSCQSQYGLCE